MINEQYIIQERNESCIQYANINQNPRDHFEHLFFVNGNGVEFSNGNPVNIMRFYREIPWAEYYKEIIPFDTIKDRYIDRYLEQDVHKTAEMLNSDYNKVYKQAQKELNNIHELTLSDILSTKFWDNTFSYNFYIPYLSLSDGYFKLQHLNHNSELTLVKVAKALVLSYIKFYTQILKNPEQITSFKPILSFSWNKEDLFEVHKTCFSDKAILEHELCKLNILINNKLLHK